MGPDSERVPGSAEVPAAFRGELGATPSVSTPPCAARIPSTGSSRAPRRRTASGCSPGSRRRVRRRPRHQHLLLGPGPHHGEGRDGAARPRRGFAPMVMQDPPGTPPSAAWSAVASRRAGGGAGAGGPRLRRRADRRLRAGRGRRRRGAAQAAAEHGRRALPGRARGGPRPLRPLDRRDRRRDARGRSAPVGGRRRPR